MWTTIRRPIPVSYTHLDVYKRQGLIQSRKDGQDKRRKAISLTPKGQIGRAHV